MIGRFFRSLTKFSAMLFIFACVFIGISISKGDFPQIILPSHDYEYVLSNGIKSGQHIKGEIFYSLGSFASKETYTQYENSRTPSKTNGYYYIVPVGEYGMAAVYIYKDDVAAMEQLTEETYNYLMGGEMPQTSVYFNGVTKKMDKELKGLERAFREELEYMGYAESEVEEMLESFSGGECLVLTGPKDMSVMYVMTGIEFAVLLWAIILLVHNYRKELEYDKAKEQERIKAEEAAKWDISGDFQNTYYTNQ